MNFAEKSKEFENAVGQSNFQNANALLKELKLHMLTLASLPPSGEASSCSNQERELARNVLESATILSLKEANMAQFERNVSQLKVYYTDFRDELPESKVFCTLIGIRLLHFLVENRMAEFHCELELLPENVRSDERIGYAIKMEQWFMEGSYSKVLEARKSAPDAYWQMMVDQLLNTVRDAIADCLEVAYQTLTYQQAQKLLILGSEQDLLAYITEHKPEWTLKQNMIWFKEPKTKLGAADVPSMQLIQENLSYAMELDRII